MSFAIKSPLKKFHSHPLVKQRPIYAFIRLVTWYFLSRLKGQRTIKTTFVDNSKLLLKRGMYGATSNYYLGLAEFEEMSFLLHFLNSEDLFVDVGANVGVYTVLASANCGAKTIACEPVSETRDCLMKNIVLNSIGELVQIYPGALSNKVGSSMCTTNMDSMNRLVEDSFSGASLIEVQVSTLDVILADRVPSLIKIDTEGHDYQVLLGAHKTLSDKKLFAVIVELWRQKVIHDYLLSFGFSPVVYDPENRRLSEISGHNRDSAIYVRDFAVVQDRLSRAKKFRILGVNL